MNRKFFLADDDADDAGLFCEALTQITPMIQCYTAENGVQLLELLSKHNTDKPDIIFLDINMPMMDGWECLRKLKESVHYQGIPTIMYSTSSAEKDIDMAYSLGASLFVTKPYSFNELVKLLKIVAESLPESLVGKLKGFEGVKLNSTHSLPAPNNM